ncbi:MAG: pyruvate dehydrogenase complex dihydrolipoamide acetyltransferase [Acidobacteriota bacterium]|nr:pyruvate dehydrogenase complex dihydrolipoamide acetyltransferase [Acidobacteriota bacterium]MDH3528955.1 pyruvate dehydrogenase complex dihydrolipoamide acetyltransferase [Acidobacteriota bacterium]
MANKILMPKLSPTMEEGQISSWVKEEGDTIEANETIAEVDTDKATMEMTSLEAGTLLKILVPAGENARLGQSIGIIGEAGEDFSELLKEIEAENASSGAGSNGDAPEPTPEPETAPAAQAPQSVPSTQPSVPTAQHMPSSQGSSTNGGRLFVSPIAARMATEHGLNLRSISGSGPNGRIIKRDVEAAIASPPVALSGQSFDFVDVQGSSNFRVENTTPMRRVIAQRLTESIGPIPTFYLTIEVEMDGTLATRKKINESIAPDKISVNDMIVKATAMALTRHPYVNASYQDDKLRFYEDADIGVAVAVEEGLITPIVRGANRKGMAQISKEISDLASRARERKLQPEEYTGATFSISNLGMMGIKEFTAIINPPESGILAIGSATPTPVVRDGEIVTRSIMNVTMSCDHRVVDGATGARFLETFKQMLENPAMMLV